MKPRSDRCRACNRQFRGSRPDFNTPPKIIKPLKQSDGYFRAVLYGPNGPTSKPINRLVLESFVGPAEKTIDAAHLNGKRGDNRLVNLKWCSRAENMSHKRLHGTRQAGFDHPLCKITIHDASLIRSKLKDGWPKYRIHKHYNLPRTAIEAVANDKWKESGRNLG